MKARLELFIVFFSLLFNRPTDRPTHFREEGGGGDGGRGWKRGNLFLLAVGD